MASNTVTIKFETDKQAKVFRDWFDGQGEQDYFTVAEMFDDEKSYVNHFKYENDTIIGENI
jgi:hypothetical protein